MHPFLSECLAVLLIALIIAFDFTLALVAHHLGSESLWGTFFALVGMDLATGIFVYSGIDWNKYD